MNRKVIVGIVVAVLVLGGVAVALLSSSNKKDTTADKVSNPTTTTANQTATATNFTVNATDDTADPLTLNVKKGDAITVTFKVSESGVYHGGLEFKSNIVDSGPIKPGESKTVTFTADKSFDFTPFWYESSVQKGYLVSVKVQ